ncbi:uncharacterized protein CAH3 isoform X1 [Eurosta solidaginis]|uniref:uncharacterized protein CAH3 isoform X1 n=1 Tax=Eurosta solidaginis TaxID=178769 RepID=UPI003530AC82
MAPFIANRQIYLNFDKCYKYGVVNNCVQRTEDFNLNCPAHEEADTKIVYHICKINFEANITIRCSDTDVAIIMLANMENTHKDVNISMEFGVGNHQRFINITKLYKNLGPQLSAALPGFHALTGCDFNPAFFRKGKNRTFQLLQKTQKYIDAFKKISNISEIDINKEFSTIEEYVCRIYGFTKMNEINKARVASFVKTYKILDNDDVFQLPKKSIDGSAMPPCQSELRQHFLRTCYIAHLWAHAFCKNPSPFFPENYGWEEKEEKYIFKWFEGTQLPSQVSEITLDSTEDNTEENDENQLDTSETLPSSDEEDSGQSNNDSTDSEDE